MDFVVGLSKTSIGSCNHMVNCECMIRLIMEKHEKFFQVDTFFFLRESTYLVEKWAQWYLKGNIKHLYSTYIVLTIFSEHETLG